MSKIPYVLMAIAMIILGLCIGQVLAVLSGAA